MKPPNIRLPRGHLLVIGTGALPVALLPGWVVCLREWYDWEIRVCLSAAATRMVSPDALAVFSGRAVLGPDWHTAEGQVDHREAAEWADAVLVVPATGNWIAKAAHGITDSLPLAITAFTTAPVFVVPSLGAPQAARPATRRNLDTLVADGFHVVPTARGRSAYTGQHELGAMPSVYPVLTEVARTLRQDADAHVPDAPTPDAATPEYVS